MNRIILNVFLLNLFLYLNFYSSSSFAAGEGMGLVEKFLPALARSLGRNMSTVLPRALQEQDKTVEDRRKEKPANPAKGLMSALGWEFVGNAVPTPKKPSTLSKGLMSALGWEFVGNALPTISPTQALNAKKSEEPLPLYLPLPRNPLPKDDEFEGS